MSKAKRSMFNLILFIEDKSNPTKSRISNIYILLRLYFINSGCGVVVSTSEHHAGGMGSNPTPRK